MFRILFLGCCWRKQLEKNDLIMILCNYTLGAVMCKVVV
jgi:hypothetical protein